MSVIERCVDINDMTSVTGKVVIALGPDDYIHLDNKDIRMILERARLDIHHEESGAGVQRLVKRWKLVGTSPI